MRQAVVGLLAHVDAGKTTLAEALLYHAGVIRERGRVDHGDSFLDVDAIERERGITLFSKQAVVEHEGARLMLVDTPGHVDFSAETERTLSVLDLAVLIVGAHDGVGGHTSTLWRLLERHGIPTVIFVNKMDLPDSDRQGVLEGLRGHLSDGCLDLSSGLTSELMEDAATTDEQALDEFVETGELSWSILCRLIRQRSIFPCLYGAALRDEGVDSLLDMLADLAEERAWPEDFAARIYKVTHERGERVSWLKVTGGSLRPRDLVRGSSSRPVGGEEVWEEKVNQVRVYQGSRYTVTSEVVAGQLCAVTGLMHVVPGDVLGVEKPGVQPQLVPVLTYRVEPEGTDIHTIRAALLDMADEDPMLGVTWDDELHELRVQLMGAVQLEVVRDRLTERLGAPVAFGPGSILYKETISAPFMGYGHFEPLRHYAEVHVRLEPLPAGSGVEWGTVCSTDDLDLNWQRLALGCAMERTHKGVLAGFPLTDVRITLVSGRAHPKHTEGGDFRQAAWRAIRQGLMTARESGKAVLLEPWLRVEVEVPAERVGRALADMQRMQGRLEAPEVRGSMAIVVGEVPAAELGDYALDVAAYSGGAGSLSTSFLGYEPCHDAGRVIEETAYEPESDLPHTPDSVFCSHGAGYTVKWFEAAEHMHVTDDVARERPWRVADAAFFGR